MPDKIEKLANDEIAVIVWPYGAGQKQIGLCFDDEENPSAIFALPTERAFLLRDAIFGTALRAEAASLRQQLDEARAVGLTIAEQRHAAEADRDLLFSELAEARRELRDGLSDRDLLTDVPPDQLVDEVLALIDRGYQQYTELRSSYVDLFANESRLLDVYRAAEAWDPEHLAQQFHEAYERLAPDFGYETRRESAVPWADVPEQNRALMVAVCAEIGATWTPAKDGDTPGELVPGEGEVPRPIRAGAEDPHPESYCHRCKGPNISWSAPSPLWNAVMRGNSIIGEWEYDEIICPPCFAGLAAERGITGNHWRLFADEVRIKLERITPSGRVWSAKTWMWDLPGEGADRRPVDVLGHAPAEVPDGERA